MQLIWQNRSASQKKDSFWKSITTTKPPRNQSSEKPQQYQPLNEFMDVQFNRSDKFIRQNSKKAHIKKKHKKESDESPKKKPIQHHNSKPIKTFIGSKLEKKLQSYLLFLTFVSSGLRITHCRIDKPKYTVYIGKGNNSKVVKKVFRYRHWWNVTNDPKNPDINLYWTQWSKSNVFARMEKITQNLFEPEEKIITFKESKKVASYTQFSILLPKTKDLVETEGQIKHFLKKNKPIYSFRVQVSHNHVEGHEEVTDKKNLFYSLKEYSQKQKQSLSCFEIVPLTFHIDGEEEQFQELKEKEKQLMESSGKLLWIVKPGQKSNRGQGISVFKRIHQVQDFILKEKNSEKHPNRTYIIQKYIFPALFHRRKFDIRCFVLLIANPYISAFFYADGYLRTSSKEFKEKKYDDKLIHLTNDAIQKKGTDYGKFEKGNKVSFEEYQAYLDLFEKKKEVNFKDSILPKLKVLAAKSIASASQRLNKGKKTYSFEILGFDFMLDEEYRPWLIEVNTNPCLQTCCPFLEGLIPSMLNNALKLAIDTAFKPPKLSSWPLQAIFTFPNEILEANKFEHIYSKRPQ